MGAYVWLASSHLILRHVNTVVNDTQSVPETGSISGMAVLFSMIQQGAVSALAIIRNAGANQITYVFQQFNGTDWVDMASSPNDLNNVLASGSTGIKSIAISSAYPQVRCIGVASGGSTLEFTVVRYFNRTDGGSIPLLTL